MTTPAFPTLSCPAVAITPGQRYASFEPVLPTPAPIDMDFAWKAVSAKGWEGHDFVSARGALRFKAGDVRPAGDVVVPLGKPDKTTIYEPFYVQFRLMGDADAVNSRSTVSAACTFQLGADQARPVAWTMPLDQASLDAIKPTTTTASKLPRSTMTGYNVVASETGIDVYNGQVAGLKPYVLGPDGRVHLRCVPLPAAIKNSQGKMAAIGQARLIAPTLFAPGDLVEWDVAHVQPGWLITWTSGEFGWPAGGEIDMEYRPDWCATPETLNLVQHYPGASSSGLGGVTPVGVDLTKPRVRSLEWSADGKRILARINGVEVQRWPMLWNSQPQIIVTQATAYLPYKAGMAMPELSLGSWVHYKRKPNWSVRRRRAEADLGGDVRGAARSRPAVRRRDQSSGAGPWSRSGEDRLSLGYRPRRPALGRS